MFGKTLKDVAAPEETNEEEVVDVDKEEVAVATSVKAAEEEQGMFCVF